MEQSSKMKDIQSRLKYSRFYLIYIPRAMPNVCTSFKNQLFKISVKFVLEQCKSHSQMQSFEREDMSPI